MTDTKELRKLVAAEADKQPLRIQIVKPKPDLVEQFLIGVGSVLLLGVLLMFGFQAANHLWPAVPAAGYADSVFLVVGMQALGSALGWHRSSPGSWRR